MPDYPADIAAAWTVHKAAMDWLFSKRQRYYRALQEVVSRGKDFTVSWPDVLGFIEPDTICRAALLTVFSNPGTLSGNERRLTVNKKKRILYRSIWFWGGVLGICSIVGLAVAEGEW